MFDTLYHPRVLELASDIPHLGMLTDAQGSVEKISRICGSRVRVDLALAGDRVSAIALGVEACALGQAAASILARDAIGAKREEIIAAAEGLRAMLKDGARPPAGRFWELRYLEGVRDYPARHLSTMLAFDAAVAALKAIDASGADASDSGTEKTRAPTAP